MCVGTQPPRAPGSALLLLGLVLGAAAQPHCTGDTYPSGNRCCKECPPGEWPGHGVGEGCLQGPRTRRQGWRTRMGRQGPADGVTRCRCREASGVGFVGDLEPCLG